MFELPEAPLTDMPTVTVPLTVAPEAGLAKEAVMGLFTVTVTFGLVPLFPPASVTVRLRV